MNELQEIYVKKILTINVTSFKYRISFLLYSNPVVTLADYSFWLKQKSRFKKQPGNIKSHLRIVAHSTPTKSSDN